MTKKLEKILVCTHNKGKLREIKKILEGLPIEILTVEDFPDLPDPVEDGKTFVENARIKAKSAYLHTGIPSLADDSGLIVPALDGAPGIYSARYAQCEDKQRRDQANRDLLRKNLAQKEKDAYFHCTVLLYQGENDEQIFQGEAHGKIIDEERGSNGFGYDPIFFLPSLNLTFAQLPPEQKNQISHRARALKKFRNWLEKEFEEDEKKSEVCGHKKYLFYKDPF